MYLCAHFHFNFTKLSYQHWIIWTLVCSTKGTIKLLHIYRKIDMAMTIIANVHPTFNCCYFPFRLYDFTQLLRELPFTTSREKYLHTHVTISPYIIIQSHLQGNCIHFLRWNKLLLNYSSIDIYRESNLLTASFFCLKRTFITAKDKLLFWLLLLAELPLIFLAWKYLYSIFSLTCLLEVRNVSLHKKV